MPAEGQTQYQRLLDGGFTEQEAQAWKNQQTQQLLQGGFTGKEIAQHWGEDDDARYQTFERVFKQHLSSSWRETAKPAENWWEAIQAGWDISNIGLAGGPPKTVLPEDAGIMYNILSMIGQVPGDLPASIGGAAAGFSGGAALGAAVPGAGQTGISEAAGAAIGTGVGAMAAPEFIRAVFMDAYDHGEILSWDDAVQRASHIMWETAKAGVIGGVSGGAGRFVGTGVTSQLSTRAAQSFEEAAVRAARAKTAMGAGKVAEGLTFATSATAMGGAMNGQMPTEEDFTVAVVGMIGFHFAGKTVGAAKRWVMSPRGDEVSNNLRQIYEATGVPPWELAERAKTDPHLKQLLLARDASGKPVIPDLDQGVRAGLRGSQSPDAEPGKPKPPEGDAEFRTNPMRIRAEHDAEIRALETKAMQRAFGAQLTPDQQLGLIARLERSGDYARNHGIDEADVVSPKGAMGRYQIMPGTARQYGFTPEEMKDPVKNREAATAILKDLTNRFRFDDGSVDMEAVLIAYNAGPGRAYTFRAKGRDYSALPAETQRYLERAQKMGAFNGQQLRPSFASEVYGIRNPRDNVDWKQFIGGKDIVMRTLPGGRIQADPMAIASYLQNFAREAGFGFHVGPGEVAPSQPAGPAYARDTVSIQGQRASFRRVYIPDTPEELNRRWYGLGRSEILFHEVGHAIDDIVFGGGKGTTKSLPKDLREEMIAASKAFRPKLWEQQPEYNLTAPELMADSVAQWISNPEMRKKMPLFTAAYGDKLEKYRYIAERNLPVRNEKGEWAPPPGGGAGEPPPPGADAAAAAGGGGQPPGPPKPRAVGPAGPPPPPQQPPFKWTEDMLRSKIEDMIAKPDDPGLWDRAKSFVRNTMANYFSELTPFRGFDAQLRQAGKLEEGGVGLEDMYRSTYASRSRAYMFATDGAFDPIKFEKYSNDSMDGAFQLARQNGGDEGGFIAYMLARRVEEKARQGITTTDKFTPEQAKEYIRLTSEKYEPAAAMLRRSLDQLFEYERESGMYSREQIAAMKKDNKYYIPFRRVDEEGVSLALPRGRSFAARQTAKRMTGSELDIDEPVTALIESYLTRIAMADRNRANISLIQAAERKEIEGVRMITDERPKMEYIDKDGKIHVIDWNKPIPPEATPEAFSLYQVLYGSSRLGKNQFMVFRDGKPEIWHIDDPLAAKIIRGNNAVSTNTVTWMLQSVASVFRAGATLSTDFIMRNIVRDAVTASAVDKVGGVPFVNWVRGSVGAFEMTEGFKDFVRKGGLGVALVDMDVNYMRRNVSKMFEQTNTLNRVTNFVAHPLEALQLLAERSDAASRFGAYERQLQNGADPFKAAMKSRKLYIDFSERSASQLLNWFASVDPFLRPALLGMKQIGEAAVNDPKGLVGRSLLYITVPTLGFYVINQIADTGKDPDDPSRYDNQPRWLRDNYWLIPIGDTHLKLPKPRELGVVFGSVLERTIEYMRNNDPKAYKELAENFLGAMTPNFVPPAIMPIAEQLTNHSFFSGQPLIPDSVAENSGYMQYTPSTSQTMKDLAALLGPPNLDIVDVSPIVLQQYVRDWSGTLGMQVLRILDAPQKPTYEIADNPFVGSFFTRYGSGTQPIDDFYDEAKKFFAAHRDLAKAMREGNEEAIDFTSEDTRAFISVNQFTEALANMRSAIAAVTNDKDMTVDEKRQFIDSTMLDMNATARAGHELLRGVEP